jgi:hypothetical protein
MKYSQRFLAKAQFALACLLLFHSAGFSYSQNSRPRYSNPNPQASQSNDMIAVDTVISLRMNSYLSSKTAHVGDKFTATVSVPVYVDGREAIPAGATIEGRVTQVTPAKRMNKSGMIAIEFDSISLPNGLSTQIVGVLTSDDPETQKQIDDENQVTGGKGKDATVFVGGSGVLGAILGGVSGGGKGAAVGGAVGAGIGLGAVLLSKGEEATVPTGTEFGLRLKQPLPVPSEANTYDSAKDNSSGQVNQQVHQDSSTQTRAQAQDSPRDAEISSRPAARYPQSSDREAPTIPNSSRDSQPEISTSSEPEPLEEDLPLTSQEMIRRAQKALNEEGYYEGEIDGVMTPRFVNSLKTYQRERSLTETGTLDMETAKSLRIVSANRPANPNARASNPSTPSRQSSERVYTDKPSTQVTIDNPNANVSSRPAGNRQPIETNSQPQNTSPAQRTGNPGVVAAQLQRQAAELLAEYQKLIGVRLTGTGIEMEGKATSDDEISLLYALDSFANSTQLYSRMMPSLQSQQAIRSATLAMAREARKTDKILSTSSTRWINVLNPKWDALRQEVLKLMYSYNINTSELD